MQQGLLLLLTSLLTAWSVRASVKSPCTACLGIAVRSFARLCWFQVLVAFPSAAEMVFRVTLLQ